MQQSIVYTDLKDSSTWLFDFLQIADNIYVDISERNRFYLQFGVGQAKFAGIGYRFLLYGNSGKRERENESVSRE